MPLPDSVKQVIERIARETYFVEASDPLFLIAPEADGRFVMAAVNGAHSRITGLPASVTVGKDPRDVLPPELAEIALARIRACAEGGSEARFDDELHFPTGRRLWETRLVPLPSADGGLPLIVGFARDVTEQRELEAELRANEARYRNLVETLQEGIWQLDADNRTTFVNPRLSELLGYSVEDMIGRSVFDFMDAANAAHARAQRPAHEAGSPVTVSLVLQRKDGTPLHALVSASPAFDARGVFAGSLGAVLDMTAMHGAEQERRELEQRLQQTQKLESLGLLAGGIAHDFNNILTGVLGSVSLARMRAQVGEVDDDALAHIEASAQRAAELCKQMLAYAGKGRFVVRQVDLSQLVRETAELLRVSIDKSVSLRFELDEKLPAIEADITQLGQVLMNLVINASEAVGGATPSKQGTITLATGSQEIDAHYLSAIRADPQLPVGRYVYLEVADNGSGMSAETIAKIFDPFFSTKFTGRGLGLSAVLGIVRGHRGAIKVYSEPGKGTTFKLLFPASSAAAETAGRPPLLNHLPRLSGTVLVVDDEEIVRNVIAAILETVGLEVVLAADGAQAVAAMRAEPERFSVVLMDMTMPNLDGVEAFRALRAIQPKLKVVLMSGYNEQDAISRFAGKGLAAFLQKPFTAQTLQQRITDALHTGRP